MLNLRNSVLSILIIKGWHIGVTLINYKGRLCVAHFTDYYHRTLRLWLLEDAEINKWSANVHELPLPGKYHPYTNKYQIVELMTRTCDIVVSRYLFSDAFHVFY
ncbi:unnamed protein product, partial [Brassica oleracea]